MTDLDTLSTVLLHTPGGNADLDDLVAGTFGVPPAPYSESVDHCLGLIKTILPQWRLHVGFGVSGILPYASLTRGDSHFEAEAPTVPLAILRVAVKVPPS